MNKTYIVDGFTVSHSGNVVEISQRQVKKEYWRERLGRADLIRSQFRRSTPGSDWGADGVGMAIQMKDEMIDIKRSGVGPKKFEQGIQSLKDSHFEVYDVRDLK